MNTDKDLDGIAEKFWVSPNEIGEYSIFCKTKDDESYAVATARNKFIADESCKRLNEVFLQSHPSDSELVEKIKSLLATAKRGKISKQTQSIIDVLEHLLQFTHKKGYSK